MEEKKIWICPLCTITFRSLEAFQKHMTHKANVATAVLANPERCAKVIHPGQ